MDIPWIIEEQTKIKHKLLEGYIGPWMGILYNNQQRFSIPEHLIYIDGFAGPGIYYEKENDKTLTCDGSPIIVGKIANTFIKDKNSRKFSMYCIDKNSECVNILEKRLDKINIFKQNWRVLNAEFENKIDTIFADIKAHHLESFPMFYFIDPFGYSSIPISVLEKILKYPRAEIFITFMIYDIVRFCRDESKYDKFKSLYGDDQFLNVDSYNSPEKRQAFLINLYIENLNKYANCNFIMPFRVNTPNMGRRPKYYLIHCSNNCEALKTMKDEMFKISDRNYSFEAIGINVEQLELFNPNKERLKNKLLRYINRREKVPYENIEKYGYIETSGVATTIKEVLVELEAEEKIIIDRKPRQHTTTVTYGAIIKKK